jgi:hypothetical protein
MMLIVRVANRLPREGTARSTGLGCAAEGARLKSAATTTSVVFAD